MNIFGIFLIKKTTMINERGGVVCRGTINQSNAFKLLSNTKSPWLDDEMCFIVLICENVDENIEKMKNINRE